MFAIMGYLALGALSFASMICVTSCVLERM